MKCITERPFDEEEEEEEMELRWWWDDSNDGDDLTQKVLECIGMDTYGQHMCR